MTARGAKEAKTVMESAWPIAVGDSAVIPEKSVDAVIDIDALGADKLNPAKLVTATVSLAA